MLTSEEKQLVKIEEYKNTINLEKCKIDQSLKKIAESLIEVKKLLPKSEWSSWLENNIDFTVSTANRYIRAIKVEYVLKKNIPEKIEDIEKLSVWSLVEVGKLNELQQKDMIKNNNIRDMGLRDIERKVKEIKNALPRKKDKNIKKCDNAQKQDLPKKSIKLKQNIIKNDDKTIDDTYNETIQLKTELLNRVNSDESIEGTLVARYQAEEITHQQISDIIAKYKIKLPIFFNKELFDAYIKDNSWDLWSRYIHYVFEADKDTEPYFGIFAKELDWKEATKCFDIEDRGCIDWCKSNHVDNKEFQLAIAYDDCESYLCIYKGYKLKGAYMHHDITDIEKLCKYDTSLDCEQLKELYNQLNVNLEAYRIRQEIRDNKQKAEYEAKRAQREKYDDALRSWREIYQPWVMGKWTFEDIWNDEGDIKDFKIWLEMTEFVSKERKKSYGDAFNSYSSFFGGAGGNSKGVVSEEDKPTYKKLYRILAKNCHPDIIKDDGQTMKLVNELKEQWGI